MKKRILMLLSVVALMVVMLAMSVAPALAAPPLWTCSGAGQTFQVQVKYVHYYRNTVWTCVRLA